MGHPLIIVLNGWNQLNYVSKKINLHHYLTVNI